MVKLYVEGSGDTSLLKAACRQGFSEFLRKAGLAGRMPRIVACGSRQDAYDAFCIAIASGETALLLVDSEAPVAAQCQQGSPDQWRPWLHLGEEWAKPAGANDAHCHLMVQCMESWFLADRKTLQRFFDPGLKSNTLPPAESCTENIPKSRIYRLLADASKDCKTKAPYGKGEHSFKLLFLLDPHQVTAASPWAKRFVDETKKRMCC